MRGRRFIRPIPCLVVLSALLLGWLGVSAYFRLPPLECAQKIARYGAVLGLSVLYQEDQAAAEEMTAGYWIGPEALVAARAKESWERVDAASKTFELVSYQGPRKQEIPFVYEAPNASYLKELRTTYDLRKTVLGAESEFQAMLALGAWLGTQWDHGVNDWYTGKENLNPVEAIEQGRAGMDFWCEIAGIVTVQAATALGWPARLVSASKTGYHGDHAMAELWSNEYKKWFILDTDFNVYFATKGEPLSAYELCREGNALQQSGELQVKRFAPAKPSLEYTDLVPFFRYVEVDLRNDWHSRKLRRGSPAGGDLATWWTAREDLGPVLTAKKRVDSKSRFNWAVNTTWIHVLDVSESDEGYKMTIGLTGYSQYFGTFFIKLDDKKGIEMDRFKRTFMLQPGRHRLQAYMETEQGNKGGNCIILFNVGCNVR